MFDTESHHTYTLDVKVTEQQGLQYLTVSLTNEHGQMFFQHHARLDWQNCGMYINMYSPERPIIAGLPDIDSLVKSQYVGAKGRYTLHTGNEFFSLLRLNLLYLKLQFIKFKQQFIHRR